MKFSKKNVALIPALALLAIGVTSCQPEESSRVSINFVSNYNEGANLTALQNMVTRFNREVDSTIEVNLRFIDGSYNEVANQTNTALSAGSNYGDIVIVYPDSVADFMRTNPDAVVNLDTLINDPEVGWTTEEKNDVIGSFLEEGQKFTKSGTYSLPFSKSSEVMFYNRAILNTKLQYKNTTADYTAGEEYQVTEELLNDMTWDFFFEELAPSLYEYYTTGEGKDSGLFDTADRDTGSEEEPDNSNVDYGILGYDSDSNLFITLAQQYEDLEYTSFNESGKPSVDFNTDAFKAVLKKWNGYAENHLIVSQGTTGDYTSNLFTVNRVLFSVGSTGGLTHQFNDKRPMDVGVCPAPHGETKAYIQQGPSAAILAHLDDKGNVDQERLEASWEFYKFVTSSENTMSWALNTSGYFPIRTSALESDAYKEITDESSLQPSTVEILRARTYNTMSEIRDSLYTTAVFPGSNGTRNAVGTLMTTALTIDGTPITDAELDAAFNTAYENSMTAIG